MLEWWQDLSNSDQALLVSASGIVLAAGTFIWNQCHQVLERRRERMIRVLLAMTNAVLPPSPGPQEVLNVDVLPAFPEAHLGLSGKAADVARKIFVKMGPDQGRAKMPYEERKKHEADLIEELAADLWKQVHPIRRMFMKPPEYRPWSKSKRNPNKSI